MKRILTQKQKDHKRIYSNKFYNDPSTGQKEHKRLYGVEYRKTHKEQIIARHKKYSDAHKEESSAYTKQYGITHKNLLALKRKSKYMKNRETELYRNEQWRLRNLGKVANRVRKRKYNLSPEEYIKLYEDQKGCCAICGVHRDTLDKNFAIDHDHITGKVRGLLCRRCNLFLGHVQDSIKLLQKAINYLQK